MGELPLIYDYARYMDSSVPSLLLDLEWRQGRRSDALPQTVDSLQDTLEKIRLQRYSSSSTPLEKVVTDNWREICLTTFETASSSYCSGVRCSLCAPAVLAAGQGCTKATGKATKDCIRGVFGEAGNCNSCIGEFTNPLSRFLNTMSSFDF